MNEVRKYIYALLQLGIWIFASTSLLQHFHAPLMSGAGALYVMLGYVAAALATMMVFVADYFTFGADHEPTHVPASQSLRAY